MSEIVAFAAKISPENGSASPLFGRIGLESANGNRRCPPEKTLPAFAGRAARTAVEGQFPQPPSLVQSLVGSIVDLKLSESFHRSRRARRAIARDLEITIGEPETAAEMSVCHADRL
jgi:hypothetical protein